MNKTEVEFGLKRRKYQNYVIWGTVIIGIIIFSGILSDGIVSKLSLIIGILCLLTILLLISIDIQYLEKRIEQLESKNKK